MFTSRVPLPALVPLALARACASEPPRPTPPKPRLEEERWDVIAPIPTEMAHDDGKF